ncbi:tyrosine-type recombinase/integrase [Blastopirellula marina]|uniref:Probable cp4-like integrase protein n=1 Tax=Blastopirellula marina DSM 3645 TaxID=314230 RepID=A3ZP16_9BACT|nr:integrase arm-type DNA-binding domain-containing protein [Blastopirellula marina]EAQ81490.1 probable cp4-like integrase protein [Blastopirellula marina DSM 3645]
MTLTDAAVRNAKPREKPYKIFDAGGLFLWVQPSGGKWWRYKYRFAGKEKLLALGSYPDISLADARERHALARKVLASGNDPGEVKKDAKRLALLNSVTTFEALAREWCESRRHKWVTSYGEAMLTRLESHVFPKIGSRPIADITAPELLAVLRIVESTGALDLAQRLLQASGQIFRYAIATGRAERNPAVDLRGALKPPVRKHQAYLKADELPEYLQKLDAYDGSLQTKLALKFLLLTFVRTGELRGAEWKEINLDEAVWRIPAERMKMRSPHIVPLSRQAVDVLRELHPLTGQWRFVFPNQHKPSGCMSENTMLFGLYRMGYHSKATGHGFRSTASTILNEHGFSPDVIERQLAHVERNQVRAAYNHAQYLPERREMMQWWADFIDQMAIR